MRSRAGCLAWCLTDAEPVQMTIIIIVFIVVLLKGLKYSMRFMDEIETEGRVGFQKEMNTGVKAGRQSPVSKQ